MEVLKKISRSPVVMMILFAAIIATAKGQLATSTLLGNVADATGSQIPNAQIHVTNRANGSVRDITSNEEGCSTCPIFSVSVRRVPLDVEEVTQQVSA